MRILIVDDEQSLLDQLKRALEGQRYMVETAIDGEEALGKLFETPFDLIILDIMLPKRDGLSVLREIRQAGMITPILMLTAGGEIGDKIKGLDLGADDYLAKPFSLDELLTRVRALFRRSGNQADSVLQVRDLRLDTVSREITKGDKPVELTTREFSILEFLLYNKNRAVSRFSLAKHVWGDAFDPFSMSNQLPINRKKCFQVVLSVIFLICFCNSGFSQDNRINYTIEIESEGVHLFNTGDSKKLIKTLALFKAKRAAVELAGKYFRRKKLIEPYEHKKDEVFNILADEIRKDVLKEEWTSTSAPSKYIAKIRVKIDVTDFIRAEILNLQYEKKEANESFRKKLEPAIGKEIKPGHDLAHAYRLIRKAHWRAAIIYLDNLEMKYPNWGDIHLAKSLAYYAIHELEAMKKALEKACQLGTEEACSDLGKIKRLHEHDFGL